MDEVTSKDNTVRAIDEFVNSLNLCQLGFDDKKIENGRPTYHPAVLLKIFIYGYMNRTRSSRMLEKNAIEILK